MAGYGTGGGFQSRSPLLAMLGQLQQRPQQTGGGRSPLFAFRRNLTEGPVPTPRAPIAQVGVSPINRSMPAAVLNSRAPADVGGDTYGAGDETQLNLGPSQALDPAISLAVQRQPGQRFDPALNQGARRQFGQTFDPAGNQAARRQPSLVPQLRNLIAQALASQRPPSWR